MLKMWRRASASGSERLTSPLRNQSRKQQRNVNQLQLRGVLHPRGRPISNRSSGRAIRSNGGGDLHQWFLANIAVSLATVGFAFFFHWGVALAFWLIATLLLMLIRPNGD